MDGVSALQMVFQTTEKRSCWVLIFIDNIEIIFNSSELHIISDGAVRLFSLIYIWCRCNSTYVFLKASQWQRFIGHQTRSNLISISKWFFQWYILLIKKNTPDEILWKLMKWKMPQKTFKLSKYLQDGQSKCPIYYDYMIEWNKYNEFYFHMHTAKITSNIYWRSQNPYMFSLILKLTLNRTWQSKSEILQQ